MTISPLCHSKILTNNGYFPRTHNIVRITPHYMCWYCDAATCAKSFVPASRRASANYNIGRYGEIVCSVEEENGAWTSGNRNNDMQAITIECANYMETANGHVYGELPKATWDSLVALVADIAKRYGFKRVTYTGDTYNPDPTAILLTKHRWFDDTDCPGPWLDQQFGRLAQEATAKMGVKPANNTNGGKLVVDGWGGYNTILDMQHALGTTEDGRISGQHQTKHEYFWAFTSGVDFDACGSVMVQALQKLIGTYVDGIWGMETSKALQRYLIKRGFDVGKAGVDGYFGNDSVKALQRCLNEHKFV